jgi:hypothetical protein
VHATPPRKRDKGVSVCHTMAPDQPRPRPHLRWNPLLCCTNRCAVTTAGASTPLLAFPPCPPQTHSAAKPLLNNRPAPRGCRYNRACGAGTGAHSPGLRYTQTPPPNRFSARLQLGTPTTPPAQPSQHACCSGSNQERPAPCVPRGSANLPCPTSPRGDGSPCKVCAANCHTAKLS